MQSRDCCESEFVTLREETHGKYNRILATKTTTTPTMAKVGKLSASPTSRGGGGVKLQKVFALEVVL